MPIQAQACAAHHLFILNKEKLLKLPEINWEHVLGALRTAGALVAGNAFIGLILSDKAIWPSLILLIIGVIVTLGASIKVNNEDKS